MTIRFVNLWKPFNVTFHWVREQRVNWTRVLGIRVYGRQKTRELFLGAVVSTAPTVEDSPAEQRLALLDAKLARFEQASVVLREIAYARPETWDDPSDFRAWAQNRGRWVLDKLTEVEA